MERVEFGDYIVADPGICHGQWTFKGTRVLVHIVLEYVAEGWDWARIVDGYGNSFPKEAIADAIRLASRVLRQRPPAELMALSPLSWENRV